MNWSAFLGGAVGAALGFGIALGISLRIASARDTAGSKSTHKKVKR